MSMPPPSGSASTIIVGTPSAAADDGQRRGKGAGPGSATTSDHSHRDATRSPGRPRRRPVDRAARTAAAGRSDTVGADRDREIPGIGVVRIEADQHDAVTSRGAATDQAAPRGRHRARRAAPRVHSPPSGHVVVGDLGLDAGRRAQPEQLVEQVRVGRDEQRLGQAAARPARLELATAHPGSPGCGTRESCPGPPR